MNKKKIIILVSIVLIIIIYSIYYFTMNNNSSYEFSSTSDLFIIKGNAQFSKNNKVINFTKFESSNDNIELSELKISLIRKDTDEIIVSKTYIPQDNNNTPKELSPLLNFSFTNEDTFNESVINNFSSILYLRIEYKDINNNTNIKNINIEVNKK